MQFLSFLLLWPFYIYLFIIISHFRTAISKRKCRSIIYVYAYPVIINSFYSRRLSPASSCFTDFNV